MRFWFILSAFVLLATHAKAKKVEGGFVSGGKETEVTFEIRVPLFGNEPNFERTQFKVRYYDDSGKLKTLKPDQASEIWFNYEGMDVRMISVVNTLGAGSMFSHPQRIFLKLEIDGPLRLYRYYFKVQSGGFGPGSSQHIYTVNEFVFQKRHGALKQSESWRWKKEMLEYFEDCPQVRSLIESKTLRRNEVEAIARLYNRACATK